MPIYEYRCRKCGNVFEEWVKTFDSPELEPCPKCGGDAERIMLNTSFKLEGGRLVRVLLRRESVRFRQ